MITIDFEKRNGAGLCEFICISIKKQILDGSLSPDEKLPSKRSLAEHLGVSVITVQNAYGQLISEGYIYSLEKKGFFVTDISVEKPFSAGRKTYTSQKTARNTPEDIRHGTYSRTTSGTKGDSSNSEFSNELQDDKHHEQKESGFSGIFTDFTSNSTGVEKFPFSLWAHIMRRVLQSSDERLLQRIEVSGTLELRKAIAEYLSEFRNMTVPPEQIIIGAGTETLYTMIVQLLGRNKNYAVENPGYHKVAKIFEINGAKCFPVKIDPHGINPRLLTEINADIVHVSPSHHFPTGIVMPVRRRLELLSWAAETPGRFILEDDYDSEFRFNGKPLPTLQSYDKDGKVIYINTFSKTLSPSFRISYMVIPKSLLPAFNEKLGFYSCSVSAFEQYTLAEFISSGFYEKHIIRMKNYYRTLRNTLIRALETSSLSKIAVIKEEEAGLHFLLTITSKRTKEELRTSLNKAGIRISMLSDFYYNNEDDCTAPAGTDTRTFVVNYSGIKKENIGETIIRLESALK